MDPYSETARNDLAKLIRSLPSQALPLMGYDDIRENTAQSENEKEAIMEEIVTASHKSLLKLTEQVLEWNQRLNLVSRKDCNVNVVYHRHVLPSVALLPLILENVNENGDINNDNNNNNNNNIPKETSQEQQFEQHQDDSIPDDVARVNKACTIKIERNPLLKEECRLACESRSCCYKTGPGNCYNLNVDWCDEFDACQLVYH